MPYIRCDSCSNPVEVPNHKVKSAKCDDCAEKARKKLEEDKKTRPTKRIRPHGAFEIGDQVLYEYPTKGGGELFGTVADTEKNGKVRVRKNHPNGAYHVDVPVDHIRLFRKHDWTPP